MANITTAIDTISLGSNTLAVNQNNISSTVGFLVTDISDMFSLPPLKNELISRSFTDGSVINSNILRESKSFSISGFVFGSTPREAIQNFNRVKNNLSKSIFTVSTSLGNIERCFIESMEIGDFNRGKSTTRGAIYDFNISISSENSFLT